MAAVKLASAGRGWAGSAGLPGLGGALGGLGGIGALAGLGGIGGLGALAGLGGLGARRAGRDRRAGHACRAGRAGRDRRDRRLWRSGGRRRRCARAAQQGGGVRLGDQVVVGGQQQPLGGRELPPRHLGRQPVAHVREHHGRRHADVEAAGESGHRHRDHLVGRGGQRVADAAVLVAERDRHRGAQIQCRQRHAALRERGCHHPHAASPQVRDAGGAVGPLAGEQPLLGPLGDPRRRGWRRARGGRQGGCCTRSCGWRRGHGTGRNGHDTG